MLALPIAPGYKTKNVPITLCILYQKDYTKWIAAVGFVPDPCIDASAMATGRPGGCRTLPAQKFPLIGNRNRWHPAWRRPQLTSGFMRTRPSTSEYSEGERRDERMRDLP